MDYPNHPPNPPDRRGNQSQEVDVWFQLTEPGMTPPDWDTTWGVARSLHSLGSNYAFVDGHVRFLRLQDTFTGGRIPAPTVAKGGVPAPPPMVSAPGGEALITGPTDGRGTVGTTEEQGELYKDMWILRTRRAAK